MLVIIMLAMEQIKSDKGLKTDQLFTDDRDLISNQVGFNPLEAGRFTHTHFSELYKLPGIHWLIFFLKKLFLLERKIKQMDTMDTNDIHVEGPGSKISLALLLRGLSLQAWAHPDAVLTQLAPVLPRTDSCSLPVAWLQYYKSKICKIEVSNGWMNCNSSPVKLVKFQDVSVK